MGKLIQPMSIAQYNDYRKAQAEGDTVAEKKLWEMERDSNYKEGDVFIIDVEVAEPLDEADVLDDLASGMDDKEICIKYEISRQKLNAIKKKAK